MNLNNLTSVIFNDVVNEAQICYHLVYPKNFNLVKKQKRPFPASGQATAKKRRRRGRPRKEDVQKLDEGRRLPEDAANDDKKDENMVQLACSRTRYGRVSRPPKHMSKFIDIKDARAADIPVDPTQNFEAEPQPEAAKVLAEPKKVRKNIDRFKCAVCKKVTKSILPYDSNWILINPILLQVYLGRKKLLRHYLTFPDHQTTSTQPPSQFPTNGVLVKGNSSHLFDELMKIAGNASRSDRISIFLSEISNFVSKVAVLKANILHKESENSLHSSSSEYYVDKNVSRVLDLPEGLLRLNDKALDDHFQQNNNTFNTFINESPTEDISSLSNLQQLGYNLNLFPQVNYDQISDNAVEAEALQKTNGNDAIGELQHESPILDIPLDLFSFNSIK